MIDLGNEIIRLVERVTKPWAKQRKAEERDQSRVLRRREALIRQRRVTVKEAAFDIMAEAYLEVSGGTLPAKARQIMYAGRGWIQERTGKTLNDEYFTQTLLPDYMAEYTEETADWNVVFDARGHLIEPHTRLIVPLGTLEVRKYLAQIGIHTLGVPIVTILGGTYPTKGPKHRYQAILFVEKEGFQPLFEHVRLAERYDLAIASTKGMSVTAARHLFEVLCGDHDIPLLTLHDFDKSGFSIAATLRENTRRYKFTRSINVIDLGLRLEDVQKWELESESVVCDKRARGNLRQNGATEEEIEFLCNGRRVELNAFKSAGLVKCIEDKLNENGIKKVIPDHETLEIAYRRAVEIDLLRTQTSKIAAEVHAKAESAAIPQSLDKMVRARLKEEPSLSWDEAVAELARECDL